MNPEAFSSLLIDTVEPSYRSKPRYILSDQEAAAIDPVLACCSSATRGYTSTVLDVVLSEHLIARKKWKGRGFAMVYNQNRNTRLPDLAGTVLHELAHYLTEPAPKQPSCTPTVQQSQHMLERFRQAVTTAPEPSAPQPMWYQHGPSFIRACSHLAYRAQFLPGFDTTVVNFGSNYYGPQFTEAAWITSLAPELKARKAEPIRAILRTPYPKGFAKLFGAATGTDIRPKPAAPVVKQFYENRFVKRQAMLEQDGDNLLAVLADETTPIQSKGWKSILLMSGFESRAVHGRVPMIEVSQPYPTVKDVVGTVRSLAVRDKQLLGVAQFASDSKSQAIRQQFVTGKRRNLELMINELEGYELTNQQSYQGISGPAMVVTRWQPMAVYLQPKQ